MKRVIAIILMLLIAANVGGVSVTHHVCGKLFQYISLEGKKKNSTCCCKGEQRDRGCCKTKVIKVKLDDHKSFSKQVVLNPQYFLVGLLPEAITVIRQPRVIVATALIVPRIHPPPLLHAVRKHVLYSVFLI